MAQPGGSYISNNSSPCSDKTYTPLSPGTDGGLSTAGYQPGTSRVTQPEPFYGSPFTVSTNATDPQTGTNVPVPSITDTNGSLSGNVSALSVAWNGQSFNQGAPKPGASGAGPSGTYDSSTGAYTLTWTSLIQGGPFNGFTGQWHLTGTFKASSPGPSTTTSAPGPGSSSPSSSGGPPSTGAATSPTPSSASVSSGTGTLPTTGGTPVPAWLGLALLVPGLGALLLGRRLDGRIARPSRGHHG